MLVQKLNESGWMDDVRHRGKGESTRSCLL